MSRFSSASLSACAAWSICTCSIRVSRAIPAAWYIRFSASSGVILVALLLPSLQEGDVLLYAAHAAFDVRDVITLQVPHEVCEEGGERCRAGLHPLQEFAHDAVP